MSTRDQGDEAAAPGPGRRASSGWRSALCLALAAAAWLPSLRGAFGASEAALPARRAALLAAETAQLDAPAQRQQAINLMRRGNPEWDMLGRMFLGLSLANLAVEQPGRAGEHLARLDALIEETSRLVDERGQSYFLLPYGAPQAFAPAPVRSVFVEGELTLLMAARNLAARDHRREAEVRQRAASLAAWMSAGPVASAVSYPDECWTFCNTAALAAIALSDAASGEDHSALGRRWVAMAKEKLVDAETGLLISSYRPSGERLDGPEGSSLWISSHFLLLIDEDFARKQYALASGRLGTEIMGFALAREWPEGQPGSHDIDSGPVVPLLEASPGSSGLWPIAAASFGDRRALGGLMKSIDLAAFPVGSGGKLSYAAAGPVGNAALLYALSVGPLWQRARGAGAEARR